MRHRRLSLLLVVPSLALGLQVAAPAVASAATMNPLGAELMRLTNVDRASLGLPAMTQDPTLVALATGLPFTCPTSTLIVYGRAQDMAARGYFSHAVLGCTKSDGTGFGGLDEMALLGYNTNRAENIALNNYGTAAAAYQFGCALDGTACRGSTDSIATVAAAEHQFMMSAGHRAAILGNYDRFGCGSGLAVNGIDYYACLFSKGGPAATTAAPVAPADTVAPRIARLTGVIHDLRRGYGHTFGASVSDNVALSRVELRVDGRLVRAWNVSGRSAYRAGWVSRTRLGRGVHRIQWVVRDRAGHATSRSFLLRVH